MSNTVVGPIYKRIIDAVVEISRTDFEENGVSYDVLQALQESWQKKLSETQRAAFPWDPQPIAAAPPAVAKSESISVPVSRPMNNQNVGGVHIKQEPSYDNSHISLPQPSSNYPSMLNSPDYARQRAAGLMQQRFGNQASGSINALQAPQGGGQGLLPQRPNSSHQSLNPAQQMAMQQQQQLQQQQRMMQQQQRMQMQMQMPKQEVPPIKQEGGQSSLSTAQNDGAGDAGDQWEAVLGKRNAANDEAPSRRLAIDGMIRRHVEEQARRMEAGGLLIPLDERRASQRNRRRVTLHAWDSDDHAAQACSTQILPLIHTGRFDGPDDDSPSRDDDIADDDAINSDLDDSEDELEGNIETEFDGDVILCLYDKVQRVKNKWKCTLKDGVVTIDGKDYVFHKAQGEFEW